MKIILSRHGNTFHPGDPVVWTGSTNDLPLVEKGLTQANRFADSLIALRDRNETFPAAILCGPLQRTRKYAEIAANRLNLPFAPVVDSRLNEVNYGDWTGLTNDQVASRFGEEVIQRWDSKSEWPATGNWGGSPKLIVDEIMSFVAHLRRTYNDEDEIVVVSSNGRLRYFLCLVDGEFERRIQEGSFKVKTGNICQLNLEKDRIEIPIWNQDPFSLIPSGSD